MSVLVAVLVGLAVVALAGPAPRDVRAHARRGPASSTASEVRPGRPRVWVAASRSRARRGPRGAGRSGARGDRVDLADLLHAVAAQVRAGVPPGPAWAAVLGTAVERQVPDVDAVLAAVDAGTRRGVAAAQRARVRAVVAGAHVAAETGAPLADVLEQLADAVAADAEQAGELEAALAGPRATARVLTSLPALGLLVGGAMGARPWQVLTDGGVGTVLGAAGVALVVGGRAWVGALLRRAGST